MFKEFGFRVKTGIVSVKPKLFLIAGHNGAGKTTFLKEFVKSKKLKYINADEIAQKISLDRFSLLAIKAGKISLRKIKEFRNDIISPKRMSIGDILEAQETSGAKGRENRWKKVFLHQSTKR